MLKNKRESFLALKSPTALFLLEMGLPLHKLFSSLTGKNRIHLFRAKSTLSHSPALPPLPPLPPPPIIYLLRNKRFRSFLQKKLQDRIQRHKRMYQQLYGMPPPPALSSPRSSENSKVSAENQIRMLVLKNFLLRRAILLHPTTLSSLLSRNMSTISKPNRTGITMKEAARQCRRDGAELASICSEAENSFLKGKVFF